MGTDFLNYKDSTKSNYRKNVLQKETLLSNRKKTAIHQRARWRWLGQTRGAIGLSLIFCFFCIKAKEKEELL